MHAHEGPRTRVLGNNLVPTCSLTCETCTVLNSTPPHSLLCRWHMTCCVTLRSAEHMTGASGWGTDLGRPVTRSGPLPSLSCILYAV